MLRGRWRTEDIGSGTDNWRFLGRSGARGRLKRGGVPARSSRASRARPGTAMVMGTASTMASMAETLGMTLPGNAAIPAADSRRMALAEMSGRRIMEMGARGAQAFEDPHPRGVRQRGAHRQWPYGGSTNAIIHLIAIAGRAGVDLPLTRFRRAVAHHPDAAQRAPVRKYLMEDFLLRGRAAGGAEGAAAAPPRRRAHRDRQVPRGEQRGRRSTTTRM